MRSIYEFRKIRFIRLLWVWGLTISTILLFLSLMITWSGIHWFIFPLNEFLTKIFENMFFAFTTGTIMMWFQNSVDGYSKMRDAYRDIELNTSLLEIRSFSIEDFMDESKVFVSEGSIPDITIDDFFVLEPITEEFETTNVDKSNFPYFDYVSKRIKDFDIDKIANMQSIYITTLSNWIEVLEHNALFYEADDLSYDMEEYIYEMKDFIKRIKSWKKGYQEDGNWLLEMDDYSFLYDSNGYSFDIKKADFFYECHATVEKTVEEKLEFDRKTQCIEDEDGFTIIFPEQNKENIRKDEWYESVSLAKRIFLIAKEGKESNSLFESYLKTEPKYHTKSPEYMANLYLKIHLFELKAKEYNRVYWKDKQEMMRLYMK